MADYRRSEKYRTLRAALFEALEAGGSLTPVTSDKVDEYMDFWVQRQQLREDVARRGLIVTDERGRTMENRSVSLGIQVARQMLDILRLLDIAKTAEEVDEL